MDEKLLKKWEVLINACKNYYIDCVPTGLTDFEFDELEKRAVIEDCFFARDYVFDKYLKGTKTKNQWIEKIKKTVVPSSIRMLKALEDVEKGMGEPLYYDLKYDGSSLAIYLDSRTGKPVRVVTVGNLNLDNFGVDQTWKLLKFLPNKFPKGIVAIQAEALIDLERLGPDIDPETARQKANGLVNSKKPEMLKEVENLLTIRAYRYYSDPESREGKIIREADYRSVISSFETTYSPIDGHILFAPADVWSLNQLKTVDSGYTQSDRTKTSTGTFLNDGWVVYNRFGLCLGALKYEGAGSGTEAIKTIVKEIQWNSQLPKGKDSWSANVLIEPVTIKGSTIRKPTAGSVSKLVENNISPGATVGIVLANSTIPKIGKVYSPGNKDFNWPTCTCGYKMSESDIFGSNLKCGNRFCTERLNRMLDYLGSVDNYKDLNLNILLVIDRFKWEDTNIDIDIVLSLVELRDFSGYCSYLESFLSTDLQRRNLKLVVEPSYKALSIKLGKDVYPE